MVILVTSRHMDVSPALKAHAEQKTAKLTKYYDRIQEIEVIFDAGGKDKMHVEVIVHAEHRNMFVAHCDGVDAYAGLDDCMSKLERQLTDHKKMTRNRKHTVEDKHTTVPTTGQTPGAGI